MSPNDHRLLLTAIGAAAVLALIAGCGGGGSSEPSSAAGEGEAAALRTILVKDRVGAPSPSATSLHAGLEEGSLPSGETTATVLTDEDCAPDAQGISHCRNEVQLSSGAIVVLRHPHDMMEVPCLEPGEKVVLRRAS